MTTVERVWVICQNDYPHSVNEDEKAAYARADELNKQDEERVTRERETGSAVRRIHYHVHGVPITRKVA